MKKLIFTLGFLSFLILGLSAQDARSNETREEARKRIDASKVAYITTYLNLSSEESAVFWPLYNAYQTEMREIRGDRSKRKKIADLNETEASIRLEQYLSRSKQMNALTNQHVEKFRTVLSDKKVLMLLKAENDFKKQMVKRYADRKGERDDKIRDEEDK